jgi:hypothetical protein
MTDLNAVPDAAQQQIQIYFGGMFDQVTMGAPMYFWLIFILGMILICGLILVAYYRLFILDKVWAFVECYKNRTPLALIRTRTRKAYLKSLKYIAQVFMDEDGPDRWFASALETSSNMEGVNLIEAVDYYDWLQDPIMNEAIHTLIAKYNSTKKEDNDKIHNPMEFQKCLSEGKLHGLFEGADIVTKVTKDQIPIPAFFIVDISKVEQYLPKNRSSSMFGGYIQHVANGLGAKDKIDPKQALLWFAGGCTAIIICGIIAGLIASGKL